MNIIDIIDKKRLKKELNKEEIEFAVNGFLDGTVKDYQMSSLLMAIVLNGMTDKETIYLVDESEFSHSLCTLVDSIDICKIYDSVYKYFYENVNVKKTIEE